MALQGLYRVSRIHILSFRRQSSAENPIQKPYPHLSSGTPMFPPPNLDKFLILANQAPFSVPAGHVPHLSSSEGSLSLPDLLLPYSSSANTLLERMKWNQDVGSGKKIWDSLPPGNSTPAGVYRVYKAHKQVEAIQALAVRSRSRTEAVQRLSIPRRTRTCGFGLKPLPTYHCSTHHDCCYHLLIVVSEINPNSVEIAMESLTSVIMQRTSTQESLEGDSLALHYQPSEKPLEKPPGANHLDRDTYSGETKPQVMRGCSDLTAGTNELTSGLVYNLKTQNAAADADKRRGFKVMAVGN
jgi:hypothetical protein